jgi:hypothetical protein
MSGVGGGMTNVLAMVAGAVAGRLVQNKLQDKVNPKLVAAGQIAAGIFLPKFVKNKFVAGIGTGMIVNGGVTLASQFGVVSAIAGVVGADEYSLDYVSGTDNLSILAGDESGDMGVIDQGIMTGTDNLSVVAGDMEDYDMTDSDY